jgi:CheY-like chemotaxis protein
MVTDTGAGMSPETLAHAFEPFFTTKGLGQGTGLGLATVYGIVKQSNGYVWADSEVGVGTTFTICLPTVSAPATSDRVTEEDGARGWETILVVEDEPSVRDLAARVLDQAGYRTIRASDAEEAFAVVHADPRAVHLVLTDVVMPGLSGRALRERLHAVAPELPVIFMSGYAGDDVFDRGLIDAGEPFIEKPFTPHALTERVRAVLDAHPAARG